MSEPALDQSAPVDVRDVVAWRRAPVDASLLLRWLKSLKREWGGYRLSVRQSEHRLEVFVSGFEEDD